MGTRSLWRRGPTTKESISGKNVRLRSLDPTDPAVVAATVIDASQAGSAVTFQGTETEECVLSGFTIRKGWAVFGGGIFGGGCQATIEYNTVRECRASGGPNHGGGLYECDGLIQHNFIYDNAAPNGEGGGLYGCGGSIFYNTIQDNYANRGGGLAVCSARNHGNFVLDNTATGNAGLGGGYYRCGGLTTNCVVARNDADFEGGGFYSCTGSILFCTVYSNGAFEGYSFHGCSGVLQNNIVGGPVSPVVNSRQPTYCCFTNWDGEGEGNFQANPRFAEGYRLAPDSPCIDAGRAAFVTVDTDLDGEPRPYDATDRPRGDGSDLDIGAYEFIGTAQPNPLPNRPVNESPMDGETLLGFVFSMVSSPFSDDDPEDDHVASQWEVSLTNDFTDIWGGTGYTKNFLTTLRAIVEGEPFPAETTFWWRVRHADSYGAWSEWSVPTSYQTRAPGALLQVPQDFATIQSAIDNSVDGDEIVVATGTYKEDIDFLGKNIVLTSTNPLDATVVATTVIRLSNSRFPTVNFSRPTGQPTFPTLTGFTIHGSPFGIDCNGADATISHNVVKSGPIDQCDGFILDNRIEGGEGILDPDEALIEGNTILSGGIQGQFSFPTIRDNLITGVSGRAITECHGLIEGNTITYNGYGAIGDCDGTIRRNVVAFNTTPNSHSHRAGIAFCNGTIEFNRIFNNTTQGGGMEEDFRL
ncbi:MAG: hypothetical protein H6752_11090 [Candidatus Omnitrophica bacterium]|nr:hypothetical protein [Candidatus Omnitrophota bacterium]